MCFLGGSGYTNHFWTPAPGQATTQVQSRGNLGLIGPHSEHKGDVENHWNCAWDLDGEHDVEWWRMVVNGGEYELLIVDTKSKVEWLVVEACPLLCLRKLDMCKLQDQCLINSKAKWKKRWFRHPGICLKRTVNGNNDMGWHWYVMVCPPMVRAPQMPNKWNINLGGAMATGGSSPAAKSPKMSMSWKKLRR